MTILTVQPSTIQPYHPDRSDRSTGLLGGNLQTFEEYAGKSGGGIELMRIN
jgi:hypothetical protein